ncbi:hypothetical protein USB125703_00640 [Pseudoclavibacter triregionum]|nr:hypothetical protein USB125703_00640 [Pseudoclavibacter triregionum]
MADLGELVRAFAEEISETLAAVVGDEAAALTATVKGDRFVVTPQGDAPIRLGVGAHPLLRLRVMYECSLDRSSQWVSVRKSEFHVLHVDDREPLFRYEFDRSITDQVPQAHLQIHAHRDAIAHALVQPGAGSRRARQRVADPTKIAALKAIHFPVGGARLRPALEDVLEMLVEEFGVEPADPDWRRRLQDGRERWRRIQLKALVRDAPDSAAEALRALGYAVAEPSGARSLAGSPGSSPLRDL